MKKKILCVLMAALMCFSLSACGNKEKEIKEQLFVETMEELSEKNMIVMSYNSYIINKMMEMSEDDRLSDFFWMPLFSTEEDVCSFEEYESIYEERPEVVMALCYDIMTNYFDIHSQEDLDNWVSRTSQTEKVLEELEPLGKDLVSCKEYIDEDCFDAAMKYYECTKSMASELIPNSESEAYSFIEKSTQYISDTNELMSTINLYYELNPDYDKIAKELLAK